MGTSAVIKFSNNTTLYIHYDGYPIGVAQKILYALNHKFKRKHNRVNKISLDKAFIAGNIDECDIIDNVDDYVVEHYYEVDINKETITHNNGFEKSIESFINLCDLPSKLFRSEYLGVVSKNNLPELIEWYSVMHSRIVIRNKVDNNPNITNYENVIKELEDVNA